VLLEGALEHLACMDGVCFVYGNRTYVSVTIAELMRVDESFETREPQRRFRGSCNIG
jgi:hypothetical protein